MLLIILLGFTGISILHPATIDSFTVTPATITLPDLDPDSYPEITSLTELVVSFSISKLNQNQEWTLAMMAPGNLVSGGDSIPIDNARWEADGDTTPSGTFQNGTLSQGVFLQVATGHGTQAIHVASGTCTIRLFLLNSWTYASGNYSRQITLRMTTQNDTQYAYFTLAASLSERLKLAFDMTGINFPAANPDVFPVIAASENPVSVVSGMRTSAGRSVRLMVTAPAALTSGSSTIAIANVTWTSSGTGYVAGTMGPVPVSAGSWAASANRSGSFSYFLANSWSTNSGTYSGAITYTLVSF